MTDTLEEAVATSAGVGSGPLKVTHEIGSAIDVEYDGVQLARYVYQSDIDQFECPMPYFHPLRSLAGDLVTHNRPHDHRWHKGLSMTASHVSEQNFWGGGSYRPGAPGVGYVKLPNVGTLQHRGFDALEVGVDQVSFTEDIDWITQAGEHWVDESRAIVLRDFDPSDASWSIEFATTITNVRGEELRFGSPTVFGREQAGYAGFFWRGPREFAGEYTGGEILASGGLSGPEIMGQRADWLAFIGKHDLGENSSTMLFDQDPDNADAPAYWFVRRVPYAVVNPSIAFYDELVLQPGESFSRRYRLTIATGRWDAERIEAYRERHPL
ncbi:PmoA family protein [Gryllotalpicola protaetiae]|uniref:Oxidoreductase n=1 Tax=Gryllotalpicola protaetiae TaxID=2419771 RepID=A0A387BIA0_9MICO|nr:PmoA family protein [Gryllotalpicola protaetiae]AYG03785.1 oxidoreductase [Gryllotalpicola protaetiae]